MAQAFGPQQVVAKEQRKIQDDAYHRRRDGGERGGEAQLAMRALNQWATRQDEHKRRQEGEPRHQTSGQHARRQGQVSPQQAVGVAPNKRHKGDHHDEWARCAFAQGQANAVVGIKDPAAVFQFVQDQLKASASHAAAVAQEAYELGQVFQAELSGFAETHFDSAHAEANKLVAQALKNAPQGSEAAVAAVKQAMDAGNKAVAEARKAAKKSADLAKQSLDQLKAKAPATKAARRR